MSKNLQSKIPNEKCIVIDKSIRMFRDLAPNRGRSGKANVNIGKHYYTHLKGYLKYIRLACRKYNWNMYHMFVFISLTEKIESIDSENINSIINRLDYGSRHFGNSQGT